MRAKDQLVEIVRIEKDQARWTAFGDRPELARLNDRLEHWTRHRRRIGERTIEVQYPNGLTEGINDIMVAIRMERITTIVAGDRDRYAALVHFREPARRRASAGSVHRTGPEDKDLRLAA